MHLIGTADLAHGVLEDIMERAGRFKAGARGGFEDRIVCAAFFEPSTRTRLSFEAAAHRLGASVIGFVDAQTTSGSKGEQLDDTVRVLAGFADALVLRHPDTGAAARAAAVSAVPVINAGDGSGEHPTQTLVDLFTIREELGDIKGRRVAVVGDLQNGRTVHSLVPALRSAGAAVVAVPAPGLDWDGGQLPAVSLEEALATCDVLYATRVQRERLPDPRAHAEAEAAVRIDKARLDAAGFAGILLHPLPRRDELARDVDDHPSAKYFQQAQNGVAVRMAVLSRLLEPTQ